MLTETPEETEADTPGHPNLAVLQGSTTPTGVTTLRAATSALAKIATHMAVGVDATLVGSRSITKTRPGTTPAAVDTHTRITTARLLADRTNTMTAIDWLPVRPTSGSAAEIPCPRVPLATDTTTATGGATSTTTMTATRTSVRATAAGLREADTREANEIAVASAGIRD